MNIHKRNKEDLCTLVEQGDLSANNIDKAKILLRLKPSKSQWHTFIHQLLLFSGILALSCGLIFFIAANWPLMHNMAKFALVQLAVVCALMAYFIFFEKPLIANACLIVAIMSVGALMALFGQTYQTGADPWQLFFNWALVITPWVVISRFTPIYMIWIGLLNLALSLYLGPFFDERIWIFSALIFNTLVLIAWQLASRSNRYIWLNNSWAINLLAIAPIGFATASVIIAVFSKDMIALTLWGVWLMTVWLFSYHLSQHVMILAGAAFSIIVALDALIIELISGLGINTFLLLIVVTLGLGTFFTKWLKKLWHEQQAQHNVKGADNDAI